MLNLERHIIENVISGRDLQEVSQSLGFEPKFLDGKSVLNYGCGGSNLGKELQKKGVQTKVIDADILPNPHSIQGNNEPYSTRVQSERRQIMRRKLQEAEDPQLIFPEVVEHENRLLGIEGRNLLQIKDDGKIDLPDQSVNVSLLLWVYHQIPEFELDTEFDRKEKLREILRVTKDVLFVAPVWKTLLREIKKIAEENGFVLMKCESVSEILTLGNMKISKPEDLLVPDLSGMEEIDYEADIDPSNKPRTVIIQNMGKVVFVRKEYLEKLEK